MSEDWRDRYIPKYRTPKSNAACRVCSCVIVRNVEYMVSWYSSCGGGQYIHICPDCVKVLYELVPK